MDYDRPIALQGDVGKRRIFSPFAYARVRHTAAVEISLSEAERYAAYYPIAWQRIADQVFRLVVVRSLLHDGRGHYAGALTTLSFLPALCAAYPFLLAEQPDHLNGADYLVDDVIADEPTDVGAPIIMLDGRPSRATEQRLQLLERHRRQIAPTSRLNARLAAADLLEPWALKFDDVEGTRLEVPNLWILKQGTIETGAYAPVLGELGSRAAWLLGLHRVSIFRAGQLLANARAALRHASVDNLAGVEL